MYLCSVKVFDMNERPEPFLIAYIFVYFSVEYTCQAQLSATVVFGTKRIRYICEDIKYHYTHHPPSPPYCH